MDGLSVAASVAGVLSLGIQVTQSLANFYSAYKHQKSDVTHTVNKLERLASVLEILQNQLAGRAFLTDEQDLLKNIEGSIQDCDECIHELQNEYAKFKDNGAGGIQATARTSARRLAYPFRQSTLQTLDESVEEVVSHISLELQILQQKDVYKVQNDIANINSLLELVKASQISVDIRQWFRAPDVTTNYNESCKKRHGGTGLWFVKGSSFSAWLAKPNSFLWLNGFAGCGKSILCSTAIQHVFRHRRSDPRIGIAFFFFTFNDNAKQDVSGQLNDNRGLLSLRNKYPNAIPPDHALLDCLSKLLRAFDDTYIILDALDESPRDRYRKDMLQTLVDLQAWSEPGLHLDKISGQLFIAVLKIKVHRSLKNQGIPSITLYLLVTSREEPDIRDVLVEEIGILPDEVISMRNDAVDGDIKSFVSGSLKSDRRLRKWEKYHGQIEEALTERANGVFRWVECQLRALDSCAKSKRQLDALLASLPRSLDKTYERMLLNISEESVEDARRTLTLLCCAQSPLTIAEIIECIAVELGDDLRLNIDGRLDDEEDIHHICPRLIEIDMHPSSEPTVRIAHFSVQEYLESDRILQQTVASFAVKRPEANAEIASLCLTYLLEPGLGVSASEYPLALYAAKSWYSHYRDGDQSLHHVTDQAIRLFRGTRGEFENWKPHGQVPSRVYYSSLFGLDSVIPELLTQGPPTGVLHEQISDLVNAKGGTYGYALQAASVGGHNKTVQLLLEKGAEINAQGGRYDNALQAASIRGHEETVRILLEKGANVNREGRSHYGSALRSASSEGHEKIVRLLLDKGANIHAQGGCLSANALQEASRGAGINAISGYGTVLQAASWGGQNEIVKLLLQKGADIHAEGGCQYGNALRAASASSHEKIVQLLIEKGGNVNAQGGRMFESALRGALKNNHEKTTKLLLEKGADTNLVNVSGITALSMAAGHGNIPISRLLLEHGFVQPSRANKFHRSPVFYAAQTGRHSIMQFLLVEMQMDPNCQDYYGSTSLSVAVRNGHRALIELLLSIPNINANIPDNFGRTPVWWAASMGRLHLVKLLTEIGGVESPLIENRKSAMDEGSEPANEGFSWCDVCRGTYCEAYVEEEKGY
ncbi:ankyrin repeat-containing domain protein [Hypoxylon crocopeplum]|nr:ankyrin repeat-containing domain protein [Hypoxylon crocopeplum]